MTTTTTDNDAKKLGGYLKEKLTIAWTRFSDDELVRAVTKVASHMLKIPNEKHLQRLINATYGQFNAGGNDYGDVNKWIVEALESHLHAHNWVVVLKTAIAYHRLMQDGSDQWNLAMQSRRGLFSLSSTKDLADSPDGAEQQIFITNYLRYLEERQIAQSANIQRLKGMRIENQAFANQLLGITGREAVTVTSSLLLQFETAIDVQFIPHAVNNFATLQGHRNCLNDAKLLFVAISRKMVNILELIEGMTPDEREAWLPIYKRYALASRKFASKLTQMKNARVAWGEALPTIRPLPDDILEQLAEMLDPRYKAPHLGTGELPRAKLSDLQAQQQQSQADHTQHQDSIKARLAEQAERNTPPILDGKIITGEDDNKQTEAIAQKSKNTMHDIFSPDVPKNNNNNNNSRNAPAASSGGKGMPDLFSSGPSKPTSTTSNNKDVDLFGNINTGNSSNNNNNNNRSNNGSAQSQGLAPPPNRGNIDDLFGPSSSSNNNNNNYNNQNNNRSPSNGNQGNNNNNNKNDDLFSSNNNNNNNQQQQEYKPAHSDLFGSGGSSFQNKSNNNNNQQKHAHPADPFASISSQSSAPSGSSSNQQQSGQQQSSSSSGNNNNNGNFVDFFASNPQSNNNNNNQNKNNNNNSSNQNSPGFDPFAPAGSKVW